MFDYTKNRDGKKLFVMVDHPSGKGLYPAIVLVHGFKGSSSQRHLQGISDSLVERGFLVVRPDLTHDPGRSYLNFEDMTYKQEFKDTEDVLDFVLKMEEVDKSKIGLAGHSLAGMLTAELASKRRDIKALSILSGVFSFNFIAERIFNKPYQKAQKEFDSKGWTNVWSQTMEKRLKIKRSFYMDIVKRNAKDFAPKIKCPTLVISGGADEAVSQKHADQWMKKLGTKDKKMEIIERSDHNYSDDALEEVKKIVGDWFSKKIA